MAQAGTLELDADVRRHLPPRSLRTPTDAPVTVRQLLTHTAGLAPFGRTGGRVRARVAPATTWVYGNRGYGLVQRVVEECSGRSFARVMATEVFEPLGMPNSAFRSGHPPLAACGLHTSARDLGRFVGAILGNSAWLSPAWRRELVQPQPFGAVEHPFMALGFRLGGAGADAIAHHGGVWRSATAHVSLWPERGGGVIVLGQRRAVAFTARALNGLLLSAREPEPMTMPTSDVEGTYAAPGPRTAPAAWFRIGRAVRVAQLGSQLVARGTWGVFRGGRTLYPTGPDRFVYLDRGHPVEVAFRRAGGERFLFVSSPIGVLTRRR